MTFLIVALLVALVSAIAVICGQAFALRTRKDELVSLQSDQKLLAQLLWEMRDTWDHLPRFVFMQDDWRELANEIGFSLPRVEFNSRSIWSQRHRDPLMDEHFGGGTPKAALSNLVHRINDPKLSELWASGRIVDLAKILRLALFKSWQPGFDLSPVYREPTADENETCHG